MKTCLISLAASAIVLQSCAGPTYSVAPKEPSYVGIHPLVLISNDKSQSQSTLVTINGKNFVLPEACSMSRQFGDAVDSRQFGDAADSRQFGDAADSRQFGDDADSRQFGDDADSRQFGDDADSRQFGDAADSRQFGDDADSRQFGDDADSRQFGDDADSRQFGDLADSRQFGNQASQYKCIKVPSINSVVITGLVGHEVVNVTTGDDFLNYRDVNNSIILKY